MSSYGYLGDYGSGDNSTLVKYFAVIICLVILVFGIDSCSISEDREKANMVSIDDTYVYDINTKIIYIESIQHGYKSSSSVTYTTYYNENGNLCRYIDGEFVEVNSNQ